MKTFIHTAIALTLLASPALAEVSQRQLHDAVADAVASHPKLGEGARVELSHVRASDPAILARARSIQRVELGRGQDPVGLVTVRAWLDVPSDPGVWTWVRARSRVLVPTVVTIRDIERGAILSRADVEVIHKAPHPQSHKLPAQVVGKRTRRGFEAGESVLGTWIEVPPLVQRGDRVDAAVLRDGLEVRAPAVALQRGGIGDVIRLKIPTTGRVVHGRILSAHRVEVIR